MNLTNFSLTTADQVQLDDDFLSNVPIVENHAAQCFRNGKALRSRGKKEESLQLFSEAFALEPENETFLLARGQMEYELDRLPEAEVSFEELVSLDPKSPSNWLTLGYIRFQQKKYQKALSPLAEAVCLDPASPDATFYLAESLRLVQRYEDSLPLYQRLLSIAMERPRVAYGYALALLALGRLEEGWAAFEFRRVCKIGTWQQHKLLNWNGVANPDSTILAYSEEGIAADIMFASCIPDLLQTAGKCIIECDETLHPLFARSFPGATLSPLSPYSLDKSGKSDPFDAINDLVENEKIRRMRPMDQAFFDTVLPKERHPLCEEEIDCQVAFGSLPQFFRKSFDDFPQRDSFLVPDQTLVQKWNQTLVKLGSRPKVGFLWQGTFSGEQEYQRTIPLESLRLILSTGKKKNVNWISLQHGSKSAELAKALSEWRLKVSSYPEVFKYNQTDELAAMLSNLDLVVSPPGYVANLAAALGIPTWLILPFPTDWRWSLQEETSPWFPKMRLFKQRHNEPFKDVTARILEAFEG